MSAAPVVAISGNRSLHSAAAQRAILGAVLLQNRLMHDVELTADDFVGSADRTLFEVMLTQWGDAQAFDLATIVAHLEQMGQLDRVGGADYVASLLDFAAVNGCLKQHVVTVKRWSQLRRIAALGERLSSQSWQLGVDPQQLLNDIENSLRSERAQTAPTSVKSWEPEIVALSDVQSLAISWIWRPYLAAGMLSMLSGDPGSGKTFVLLAIAAALSTGRQPGDKTTEPISCPTDVLYLSIENSPEYVIRPRFDSLYGNPAKFHLLRGAQLAEQKAAVTLSDVRLLGAAIQKTKARFVIVDPIQSYLGAQVDAHRSNETRPVMDGLVRPAEEYKVSIVLARHLAKAASGKAVYRGLGSIDLTGAVRTELTGRGFSR
jgi:hypothetical protein